ncbi:hypothetical protein NECAME_17832 [Necator americanus]|uniref:Integrase catalytic domain-containing protein n=1 Tax=Necator americanus TaxID=51031 RepID=W2TIX1_NECAM|nr:hypothetical protein NECAME_17832 [Necator americanus]ETN81738.1 hypothetical protein NECAME_17832 [Necator americanus]
MSRNFGLGSRVMADAGRMALDRAADRGEVSFSTAATQADRWAIFSAWLKAEGINRMEHITRETVTAYGQGLAAQVRAGELAPATAQNYVSAVNSVMALATKGQWQSVSPTKECGIEQRSSIRAEVPGAIDRARYGNALNQVRGQLGVRAAAVVELARELGLRSKEGSLLDARVALAQAERTGLVDISEGTKGGLERTVPITTPSQMHTLQRAAQAQGEARAVMPPSTSWKEWREGTLRDAREIVQSRTQGGLHDLRSAYACDRYETMTGHMAPCAGGQIRDRGSDQVAREEIAQELGHGRAEVVAAYVGAR